MLGDSLFKSFFQDKKHSEISNQPVYKILDYMISMVAQQELILDLIQRYEDAQKLSEPQKTTALLDVYYSLETILLESKPPLVKKEYTKELLLQEIAQPLTLKELPLEIRLVLLSPQQQIFALFQLGLVEFANYIIERLGRSKFEAAIDPALVNSEFVQYSADIKKLFFDNLYSTVPSLSSDRIVYLFKSIYSQLNATIIDSLGEKEAQDFLRKLYEKFHERYQYEQITIFLSALPEELFRKEKLTFLSRSDLEKEALSAAEEKLKREQIEKEKEIIAEQVRLKTKELESIIENLPVGVFLAKASTGELTLINKAGTEILGKGVEPGIKKDTYVENYHFIKEDGSLYPNEELPITISLTQGVSSKKTDVFIARPEGQKTALKMFAEPIKNSQGKIATIVTVFEDISKESEIDKAKTEFVSLASHQIGTPLSAIGWNAQFLLSGQLGEFTPEQKERLVAISDSYSRVVELVNGLLNVSRLELGTFAIDPKAVNLAEVAKSIIDELAPKIKEKELNMVQNYEQGLPMMNTDPVFMRIIFQNLITNAVKYTRNKGTVMVAISRETGENNITISVKDNGMGIPKAEQGKIFTKLFRAANVKAEVTQGTGLGLYIVRMVVEKLSGHISFDSQENQGTTFFISLPLIEMQKKSGKALI